MTDIDLSITEYAQMYDISPHTVYNKVSAGEIRAEKWGNKWMIQVPKTEVPLELVEADPIIEKLENHITDLQSTIENIRTDLQSTIDNLRVDMGKKESQIDELIKQNDQSQKIIAMMEQDRQALIQSQRSPISKFLNFIGVSS